MIRRAAQYLSPCRHSYGYGSGSHHWKISSSNLMIFTSSIGAIASMTTVAETSSSSTSSTSSYGERYKPPLVSSIAIKGRRPHMEDEVVISDDRLYSAVFDGHGGPKVSEYASKHAYPTFASLLTSSMGKQSNEEVAKILTQSLLDVDKEVEKNTAIRFQGSTACVVYLNNQKDETSIITANVGDSRAVLSRNQNAIELSVDHKPNSPSEQSRIEALGGKVVWVGEVDKKTGLPIDETGVYRVNGNLALSRALGPPDYLSPFTLNLGDVYMKPFMSPVADITTTKCTPEDEFVIIATDGLWDVFSSQIAVKIVHQVIAQYSRNPPDFDNFSESDKKEFLVSKEKQLDKIRSNMAMILAHLAFDNQSWDNISVVVLWLK